MDLGNGSLDEPIRPWNISPAQDLRYSSESAISNKCIYIKSGPPVYAYLGSGLEPAGTCWQPNGETSVARLPPAICMAEKVASPDCVYARAAFLIVQGGGEISMRARDGWESRMLSERSSFLARYKKRSNSKDVLSLDGTLQDGVAGARDVQLGVSSLKGAIGEGVSRWYSPAIASPNVRLASPKYGDLFFWAGLAVRICQGRTGRGRGDDAHDATSLLSIRANT